jgi:hypothetical protein
LISLGSKNTNLSNEKMCAYASPRGAWRKATGLGAL